jgi:hypothetical protein
MNAGVVYALVTKFNGQLSKDNKNETGRRSGNLSN